MFCIVLCSIPTSITFSWFCFLVSSWVIVVIRNFYCPQTTLWNVQLGAIDSHSSLLRDYMRQSWYNIFFRKQTEWWTLVQLLPISKGAAHGVHPLVGNSIILYSCSGYTTGKPRQRPSACLACRCSRSIGLLTSPPPISCYLPVWRVLSQGRI